jgi:hypothetical protein
VTENPQSVTITHSPLACLRGNLLLIPLILAIVLGKSNVRLHLLWLLIPYAILKLSILLLAKLAHMPSDIADIFEYLSFGPLLIGMASCTLLGTRLSNCHGILRFICAIVIFLACIGFGIASFGFTEESIIGLIASAVIASSVTLANTMSARLTRKRFHKGKYLLWLAINSMMFIFIGMAIYILIAVLVGEFTGDELGRLLPEMLLQTAIFGAILYVVQLPIVLLGLFNRFYQERFYALMGATLPTEVGGQEEAQKVSV